MIARRVPLHRSSKPIPRKAAKPKRTKAPAKKRKTTLAAAKRTLWAYFAGYVKARDENVCFTCDKVTEGVRSQAGHLFSRAIAATLYDFRNVHAQCASCNCGLRGNVPVYVERFIARYGVEEFNALTARAQWIRQWKLHEVLELTAALKRGGADFETLYAEKYMWREGTWA